MASEANRLAWERTQAGHPYPTQGPDRPETGLPGDQDARESVIRTHGSPLRDGEQGKRKKGQNQRRTTLPETIEVSLIPTGPAFLARIRTGKSRLGEQDLRGHVLVHEGMSQEKHPVYH